MEFIDNCSAVITDVNCAEICTKITIIRIKLGIWRSLVTMDK
jgi:hypothetical protein